MNVNELRDAMAASRVVFGDCLYQRTACRKFAYVEKAAQKWGVMIFSEWYGAYYNAVAKILKVAAKHPVTKKEMRAIIKEQAFSESILAIEPALFGGRWPLLRPDGSAVLKHAPDMPLSLPEKRWLKAISLDPRIQLFEFDFGNLYDVTPLFTPEDVYIFDQYADGDPYGDEKYIAHFRQILDAVKKRIPLSVDVENRYGQRVHMNVIPEYLEYSEKDDKFRLITSGCRYGRVINLAKILSVKHCKMDGKMAEWMEKYGSMWDRKEEKRTDPRAGDADRENAAEMEAKPDAGRSPVEMRGVTMGKECVVFELYDGRNALERALLHFAHFEKEAERVDEKHYRIKVNYERADETELLIRVLSFGPFLRVVEPERFVGLVKERLMAQYQQGGIADPVRGPQV